MVTYLGGIFIRECTEERFQPVKFLTNETSNCIFAKSFCSEEGSVLVDNGTTRTDVKCRCDYTKDYSYVNEPRDKCGCQPTVDDCSCYLKTCPGSHVLSQGISGYFKFCQHIQIEKQIQFVSSCSFQIYKSIL